MTTLTLLSTLVACGGGGDDGDVGPVEPSPVAQRLTAVATSVPAGDPIRLRLSPVIFTTALTGSSYPGTVNGQPARFGRLNDSTLTTILPPTASGATALTVSVEGTTYTSLVTTTAATGITAPGIVATAYFDAATRLVQQPSGAPADSATSADSAQAMRLLVKARADFAALPPDQQLALARVWRTSPLITASISATRPPVSLSVQNATASAACVTSLNLWKAVDAAATESDGYANAEPGSLKESVQYGIAAAAYLTAYARGKEGTDACQLPSEYKAENIVIDDDGTRFDLTAVQQTMSNGDFGVSPTAALFTALRRSTQNGCVAVAAKVGIAPCTPYVEKKAPERFTVDPQFVTLSGNHVLDLEAKDAESPAIRGTKDGKMLITVNRAVEAETMGRITLRIRQPNSDASQLRTIPIPIQRCEGEPTTGPRRFFRYCAERVSIVPLEPPAPNSTGLPDLALGATAGVRARVFASNSTELFGRKVRWTRSSDAISLSAEEGDSIRVTAAKEAGLTRVTAAVGYSITSTRSAEVSLSVSGMSAVLIVNNDGSFATTNTTLKAARLTPGVPVSFRLFNTITKRYVAPNPALLTLGATPGGALTLTLTGTATGFTVTQTSPSGTRCGNSSFQVFYNNLTFNDEVRIEYCTP